MQTKYLDLKITKKSFFGAALSSLKPILLPPTKNKLCLFLFNVALLLSTEVSSSLIALLPNFFSSNLYIGNSFNNE